MICLPGCCLSVPLKSPLPCVTYLTSLFLLDYFLPNGKLPAFSPSSRIKATAATPCHTGRSPCFQLFLKSSRSLSTVKSWTTVFLTASFRISSSAFYPVDRQFGNCSRWSRFGSVRWMLGSQSTLCFWTFQKLSTVLIIQFYKKKWSLWIWWPFFKVDDELPAWPLHLYKCWALHFFLPGHLLWCAAGIRPGSTSVCTVRQWPSVVRFVVIVCHVCWWQLIV